MNSGKEDASTQSRTGTHTHPDMAREHTHTHTHTHEHTQQRKWVGRLVAGSLSQRSVSYLQSASVSQARRHIKLFWAKITNSTTNVTQHRPRSTPLSPLSVFFWLSIPLACPVAFARKAKCRFSVCAEICVSMSLCLCVCVYIRNTATVHVDHLYSQPSPPPHNYPLPSVRPWHAVVGVYHKCFEPLKCSSEPSAACPYTLYPSLYFRVCVCVCAITKHMASGWQQQQQCTKFNANSKNNESICFAKHKNMSK